ncbi:hypothetical protein CC1G_15148 [Coprinopsis cinerea okayama7|uniref:Uncharacterized protein n=1 Tax=Coprinopsis cinerea (strain Okayama-7 / 130 / ATCC MYA-4618 / FGSC 9003) TaxID=240176 RepID=D6RPQ2_COPC7|nr:hypothetical protein CC1G_15148 [Coprinopsis cinerea okayama7\|eukprot:XP_002910509.1 hypothetical protein CC1G_15148 [Coprinopsis cinerea okayama7\
MRLKLHGLVNESGHPQTGTPAFGDGLEDAVVGVCILPTGYEHCPQFIKLLRPMMSNRFAHNLHLHFQPDSTHQRRYIPYLLPLLPSPLSPRLTPPARCNPSSTAKTSISNEKPWKRFEATERCDYRDSRPLPTSPSTSSPTSDLHLGANGQSPFRRTSPVYHYQFYSLKDILGSIRVKPERSGSAEEWDMGLGQGKSQNE